MKKTVSFLLALIFILTPCTAFAEWQDEISYRYITEINGKLFIRIAFDEKYDSFADDINISIENCKSHSFTDCSGNAIKCVKEKAQDYYTSESLVIYIPCIELAEESDSIKIHIPENSVFDQKGNGNKETVSDICYKDYNFYDSCFNTDKLLYLKGKAVTYKSYFPVDYYVNDTLVSENSFDYKFNIESHGIYKVEARKFGIILGTDEFNTENKRKEYLESYSKKFLLVSGFAIISPAFALLSPLFILLPPLMAVALASPFYAFGVAFDCAKDLFYLLTH